MDYVGKLKSAQDILTRGDEDAEFTVEYIKYVFEHQGEEIEINNSLYYKGCYNTKENMVFEQEDFEWIKSNKSAEDVIRDMLRDYRYEFIYGESNYYIYCEGSRNIWNYCTNKHYKSYGKVYMSKEKAEEVIEILNKGGYTY